MCARSDAFSSTSPFYFFIPFAPVVTSYLSQGVHFVCLVSEASDPDGYWWLLRLEYFGTTSSFPGVNLQKSSRQVSSPQPQEPPSSPTRVLASGTSLVRFGRASLLASRIVTAGQSCKVGRRCLLRSSPLHTSNRSRLTCCSAVLVAGSTSPISSSAIAAHVNGFCATMANHAVSEQLPIMVRKPKVVWPGLVKMGMYQKAIAGDGKYYSSTFIVSDCNSSPF